MCDLWKNTLSDTVPLGAIPTQIDYALGRLDVRPEQIKLYNSGSFFDSAAIPFADYQPIAEEVSFAKRVVVECHPRLVGKRVATFRDLLQGAQLRTAEGTGKGHPLPEGEGRGEGEQAAPPEPTYSYPKVLALEVAVGLETVHPDVLPRLNKKFDLDHFAAAARFLREEGIGLRAFVLVKPPFLNEAQALEWAVKSAEFAFSCGATVVSLIPTRGGNGAMERLMEAGEFSPPRLATLEKALEACLELQGGRVFADNWNLEQFSNCPHCFEARRSRLEELSLTQEARPPIDCWACGGL
jgi:uncharacterized Fe-S cluster-containing MiaB family protein